jgi:hypothetical protein
MCFYDGYLGAPSVWLRFKIQGQAGLREKICENNSKKSMPTQMKSTPCGYELIKKQQIKSARHPYDLW